MRNFVVNCWDPIMNAEVNLSNIPDHTLGI